MMLALCTALSALALDSAAADTLIDNVNGRQIDRAGQLQQFTGLLVGNDGKVVQLLGPSDPRPRRVDFRVDGLGRALLPGLIDAHGHVMRLGLGTLQLDVTGARSIPELQQRLASFAAAPM